MPTATPPAGTTRQNVLTVASAAFADRGLDGVTLDEIAQEAGVHRVTLHRNFPGGRDELVVAVIHRQVLDLSRAIAATIDAAPDCTTALVDAVTLAYDTARTNRALAALLADPHTRAALHGPAATALRDLGADLWARVRARAHAEGRTTTDGPDDEVVDYFFRLGVSLIAEPGIITGPDTVRAYVRRYLVPPLILT
jgi:AcrR family transcriptional regulator